MSISDLRRSQIVIPFGPGSVYDYKDFSAMTMEVDEWDYSDKDCDAHQIRNARFIKFINKKLRFYEGFGSKRIYKLLHPPIAYDSNMSTEVRAQMGAVKVSKFPHWGLCSRCNALSKFDSHSRTNHKCRNTRIEPRRDGTFTPCSQIRNSGKIEPVRFISYCGKGHVEDIPWIKIMKRKCSDDCDMQNRSHTINQPSLYLSDNSLGNGFASLMLQCGECKTSTTLNGIDNKIKRDAFIDEYGNKIFQCSGKKPWSRENDIECDQMLEVQPRAASKIYSAVQCSSIFVPESEEIIHDFILDPDVQKWIDDNKLPSEIKTFLEMMPSFGEKYALNTQQMLSMIQEERDVIRSEMEEAIQEGEEDDNNFLYLEYETLCKQQVDHDKFISKVIPSNNFSSKIKNKFNHLSQVKKLYSSVALLGFTRMTSEILDKELTFNASRSNANFLPGYEIIGEGIFIDFGYEKIQEWRSANPNLSLKEDQLRKNSTNNIFNKKYSGSEFNYGHVMMHTFSHLLMNQLSIECGYALTEIKERIYFCEENKMAGILIYTASSDSAGSLGGLVRMIKPNYFESLVENAIANAQVCSNDPICNESIGQGHSALCLASCHACAMVPDLACSTVPSNVFLDRNALIGDEINTKGYFSDF
jgi:hypothetical protein